MKKLGPVLHVLPKWSHIRLRAPLIFLGIVVLMAGLPSMGLAASNKVLICHYPPGNPDNRHILSVSEKSLAAHLRRGDNLLGEEVCDLVDNDCDGLVDEDDNGDPLTNPTTCGVGDCAGNIGVETCENGEFVNDTCDPLEGGSDEVCDGIDNNCDGCTDEDAFGDPLTRATTCGDCAGNFGFETCEAGVFENDTCDPLGGEVCDGFDNDCDGFIDEGTDLCGLGQVCAGSDGCIIDPTLTCPCDAFLNGTGWDDGIILSDGCVDDSGGGFPEVGEIREVDDGPATVDFTLDSGDVEPDGIRDYTCTAIFDPDGISGGPGVFSLTLSVDEQDLLGCAVRMSSTPASVLDCILPPP